MTTHRTSWSNPKVLAALLLVFLCGAAFGALALRLATRPPGRTNGPDSVGKSVARFQQELNLSSEQAGKLEIILDDYMKYMHDLQSQMDDVRVHGKEMVLKILNEEQRKKFEKLIADAKGRPLR
jgi:Spy/CpxP family protein refolding chaperone